MRLIADCKHGAKGDRVDVSHRLAMRLRSEKLAIYGKKPAAVPVPAPEPEIEPLRNTEQFEDAEEFDESEDPEEQDA